MRTRPCWRVAAVVLTLPILLAVTAPVVSAQPVTTTPPPPPPPRPSVPNVTAEFSRAAMTPTERALLPEAVGKVTRAGKVGSITAWPGDIVLPGGATPEAPTPAEGQVSGASTAVVQADSTVLHGPHTRTEPASENNNWRGVVAVQENQSDEVRAYAKSHIYNIYNLSLVLADHNMDLLRATNFDWDSAGDGCGPYPSGSACSYEKNPVGAHTKDYYALGQYRHKCGAPGYNCKNSWTTLTWIWKWTDPAVGYYFQVEATCSYIWDVLYGPRTSLACEDSG